MNRKDIIKRLDSLDIPRHKYVVLFGASMVMRGLRDETADIDLATTKDSVHKTLYLPGFDVSDDIDRFDYELVNGYQCQKLEDILKWKKIWNRPKDRNDILEIEEVLNGVERKTM